MEKACKLVLDQLDNLMISLSKQKKLGLDVEVIIALKELTKTRNALKREHIKTLVTKEKKQETIFTNFLDKVADNA